MSGDVINATTNEINIVETVQETINTLCNSLFESIKHTIFPLLDEVVFIDTNIMESTYMEKLFGASTNSGVLLLANCLLTAFVLYYCIRLLISHLTNCNIESIGIFFIKAIFAAIFMNYSLDICSFFIESTFELSSFFCELGKDIFNKNISFVTLTNEITKTLDNSFNMFSLDGILSSTLYISSFTLIINFSFRYIILKVLILLSPFSILCTINHSTFPIFKAWLKSFLSLLFLQIIISIILLLPFAILKEDTNSYFNKLLLVRNHSYFIKI